MGSRDIEIIARGLSIVSGHALLCQNLKRGYFYLPGGHVEFGEDSPSALAREYHEEAALPVRVGPLLAVHELRFVQSGRERHEISLVFHVELPSNVAPPHPVISQEREIAFQWVPISDAASLDVRPAHARRLIVESSPGVAWATDDERPAPTS